MQMNESIVAKTTITVPVNGGTVEAVSTIEAVPYWTRSRQRSGENFFFSPTCLSLRIYQQKTNMNDYDYKTMCGFNLDVI